LAFCELCSGPLTLGKEKIIVDGAVLSVCRKCSKRGKPVASDEVRRLVSKTMKKSKNQIGFSDKTVLEEDYAEIIRHARTDRGLTHEQLGSNIKEKSTLLRRLETGSLKPDETLARKLERFLGIKLYVEVEDLD
jgi:putative transcription factor